MAAYGVVQAQGGANAATFAAGVTEGNLLWVTAMERSGQADPLANYTISGSGWSGPLLIVLNTDATCRRTMVAWWKVAGAGEPTTITVGDGTGNTKAVQIAEFTNGDPGVTPWFFIGHAAADNGTTQDASSQATGTVPDVPAAGDKLLIGSFGIKRGGSAENIAPVTWATETLTSAFVLEPGSNGRGLALGWAQQSTGGSKASTATFTAGANASNAGLMASIAVFSDTDPGGGDTTDPVITGPTGAAGAASISVNVAENTTTVGDWNADESVTWSISGTDAAFFSIDPSTGALSFVAPPDFEAPGDAGANNTYDLVVRATDGASNFSEQTVAVNVTDAGEDTTNPGAPGTPTFASVTKASATVNYSAASDNVAVTGYERRVDGGGVVDVGNALNFDLSGLTPGTTYTVEVRAYDAAGNRGAWASADLTTLIYGFDLDTEAGAIVGSIAGSLTGLGKVDGVNLVVCAYSTADDTLVAVSGALACTAGRLPRWEHAALDAGTYDLKIRPAGGGAPGWLRLASTTP